MPDASSLPTIAEIAKASTDARQSDELADLRRELVAVRAEVDRLKDRQPGEAAIAEVRVLKAKLQELTTAHNAEVGKRQQTDRNVSELGERGALVSHDGDATVIRMPDGTPFRIAPARGSFVLGG